MKNIFAAILFAVLAAFVTVKLTMPQKDAAAKNESVYDRVMRTKTLRCGYLEWPPFIIRDMNSHAVSGVNAEMVTRLSESMGLKVEWVGEFSPGDVEIALRTNKIDMYCLNIFETAARARVLDFVGPVGYAGIYPYVRADEARITALTEINKPETIISTFEGEGESYLAHAMMPQARFFEVPSYGTSSDKFMNVIGKKADVVMSDAQTAASFMEKNPSKLKRASDEALGVFPISFAIRKNEVEFYTMLNQNFRIMLSSGEIERIYRKYNVTPDTIMRPQNPYQKP